MFLCDSDGTNVQRLTIWLPETGSEEITPAWSPDGSKITFSSNYHGNHEIYVIDSDGTNPQRLTNNIASDFSPAYSPDGSLIAFTSDLAGTNHWEIYIMNTDGTYPRRLTYTPFTSTSVNRCWQPPDKTAVAVYLANFSCTRGDGTIKIVWTVRDAASVEDFRLVAAKDGRQRDVPVCASGVRGFESIDEDPSLKTGGTVLYSLYAREDDGGWSLLRTSEIVLAAPIIGSRLSGIYPNPFNPRTIISFKLGRPQLVKLEVHDAAGRLVEALAHSDFPAGEHQVTWDGRNTKGEEVSSGVYFLKFEAGEAIESRKLVLVK